ETRKFRTASWLICGNVAVREVGIPLSGHFPKMVFQPALECIHICIEDWRQIQRNHLREDQSAYHCETEWTTSIGACADSECDGRGAHQRRHRGHGNRAETDQTAFIDRFRRGLVAGAFALDGEINHHDRVLLYDAD